MTFTKENTLIIFGTSPYINEIKEYIEPLQNKYNCIALNTFSIYYPNSSHWLLSDAGHLAWYKQSGVNLSRYQIITTKEVYDREMKYEGIIPHHLFNSTSIDTFNVGEHTFPMYKTSVHPAICYGVIKKYTNVVLIGIELNTDWSYFDGFKKTRPLRRIKIMRNVLYKYKNLINIYKTNANNTLDLECLDINGLL